MSKKLSFNVTLTFESKITDDNDILEIAKNIARAIKNEANSGMGITTDFSDTYTETIEVKPQYLDESVIISVID
jgi:hypothetical protein